LETDFFLSTLADANNKSNSCQRGAWVCYQLSFQSIDYTHYGSH